MTSDEITKAAKPGADLRGADLRGADLRGADLRGADLRGADLHGADLRGADLHGANLYGADLYGANLYGADLYGANLYGANLYGANLRGALNLDEKLITRVQIVPQAGAFRAFKKVYRDDNHEGVVVAIEVTEDAQRLGGLLGRKCRASKAIVLGFLKDKETPADEPIIAHSGHDSAFKYFTGAVIEPTNGFETDPKVECAPGIHFFLTYEEAEEYR